MEPPAHCTPFVPDYLVIGQICQDIVLGEGAAGQPPTPTYSIGGTVTFAARTAQALGKQTAILTSAAPDFEFAAAVPGMAVCCRPAPATTTFENRYHHGARQQILHAVAETIALSDVPAEWVNAALVHLGPLAQDVDPALVHHFPHAFIGVTPQGWLRAWDAHGQVYPCPWPNAAAVLPHIHALVLSIEDVEHDEALVQAWATQTPVIVVTRGAQGATVHTSGVVYSIPAPVVQEVDPTGAGDIFAAAFFICLQQTQNPRAAAHFAAGLASASVTRRGLASIPTQTEIAQYHARAA